MDEQLHGEQSSGPGETGEAWKDSRAGKTGTLAAAAATVYIIAQFMWATSRWVPKEEERTKCIVKDAHGV